MKYTVVWQPSAQQELTDLWIESARRNALTAAADEFDRMASTNPEVLGESRDATRRIVILGRLVVLFAVHELDRQVIVLDVRLRVRP